MNTACVWVIFLWHHEVHERFTWSNNIDLRTINRAFFGWRTNGWILFSQRQASLLHFLISFLSTYELFQVITDNQLKQYAWLQKMSNRRQLIPESCVFSDEIIRYKNLSTYINNGPNTATNDTSSYDSQYLYECQQLNLSRHWDTNYLVEKSGP